MKKIEVEFNERDNNDQRVGIKVNNIYVGYLCADNEKSETFHLCIGPELLDFPQLGKHENLFQTQLALINLLQDERAKHHNEIWDIIRNEWQKRYETLIGMDGCEYAKEFQSVIMRLGR